MAMLLPESQDFEGSEDESQGALVSKVRSYQDDEVREVVCKIKYRRR